MGNSQNVLINNALCNAEFVGEQLHSGDHWIAFKTVGTRSNRDGIGARISAKMARERSSMSA